MKKQISLLIVFLLALACPVMGQDNVQFKCLHSKGLEAAQACLEESKNNHNNPALSLYFLYQYYANVPKSELKKMDSKAIDRRLKKYMDRGMSLPIRDKTCLTAALLPWSLHSGYISDPNNTLDRNLANQLGNFRSIIQSSNMGLGLETSYSFQTLTNSIRLIYTNGKDIHVIMLLYYLGKVLDPANPGQGMLQAFQTASRWNYHKGLFGNREEIPQYGTSLMIIDLIKSNKLTPLTKKIVSAFMTGNGSEAVNIMFSDQKEVEIAFNLYNDVIIKNYCNFPM